MLCPDPHAVPQGSASLVPGPQLLPQNRPTEPPVIPAVRRLRQEDCGGSLSYTSRPYLGKKKKRKKPKLSTSPHGVPGGQWPRLLSHSLAFTSTLPKSYLGPPSLCYIPIPFQPSDSFPLSRLANLVYPSRLLPWHHFPGCPTLHGDAKSSLPQNVPFMGHRQAD